MDEGTTPMIRCMSWFPNLPHEANACEPPTLTELGGIGARELGGTDDWRNRRDQNRSSRSVAERSAARIGINENSENGRRPGKLNGKATTLQEKRGLSRKSIAEDGKDWGKKLHLEVYAIRTHTQSSLGHSPYELLFGRTPRTLLDMLVEQWEETDEETKDLLMYTKELRENLQSVWDRAHDNLREAQEKQKKHHYTRSVLRTLSVRDKALILLPSSENKLLARWQGPYEVIERINPTTYRLALPIDRIKTKFIISTC
ncbi:hypothetical protein NDU88_005325 [Pleurodeles waltl]|uniref:Tf2-1-like SH3-like domain-containing protein n=1 Tax=Pleurodeles waltl TaxID=8319 RepID=A0AAV7TAA5_PLEWA|nr:hypothetical protein NDU88_005325 [Pleurodeles waltl]